MAICDDNTSVTLSEKQEKISQLRRCGDFLCKHWPSLTAALAFAVGGNPALPLSLFLLSCGVVRNPNITNDIMKAVALAVMVGSAFAGMFSSVAALPRMELEYPPNSEGGGLNRKAYETLMTPLFYIGKYPSYSASFFLNRKAVKNVTQRIQAGENTPFKDETGDNWWKWGHFAPVRETVRVDGAMKCRNLANTQVLMEVEGEVYGYTRPTNKAAWTQVDLAKFPYAEACAPR